MTNLLIAIFAYLIDKIFGEFPIIKHPVIAMGEMITFFEDNFYKDSIFRGILLVLFMMLSIALFSITIHLYLSYLATFLTYCEDSYF